MSEEQIENLETPENQVEIKNSKRKILIKLIVLLSIILIIGIYIFSGRQSTKPEIEDAINLGRTYSHSLLESYWFTLDGEKQELKEISTGKAEEKIKSLKFQPVGEKYKADLHNYLTNKRMPFYKRGSLFAKESDMELINLERTNNLVSLTFAYKYPAVEILDNDKMLSYFSGYPTYAEILSDNKMLFYITLSYDTDNNWTVCDFDYNYNLNDYYNWLSKEAVYVNKLIDK